MVDQTYGNAKNLSEKVIQEIDQLLELKPSLLLIKGLTIKRTPNSNLTNKPGLYLLCLPNVSMFYIGSSSNLAQRKGEHHRDIKNKTCRYGDIVILEHEDLEAIRFIPLVVFDGKQVVSNISGCNLDSLFFQSKKEATEFFSEVELMTIDRIIKQHPDLVSAMLNKNTQNRFIKGVTQTIRRSVFSGSTSKPVTDGEKIWPSVAEATRDLGVARKTIRNWIQKGEWSYVS